jgi:hypothetical protein
MSTVVSKNVQIGADGTASNNFTAYQPAAPDGTLRIGNGNSGSVTDAITLTSAGNVGIGTTSPAYKLHAVRSGGGIVGRFDTTSDGITDVYGYGLEITRSIAYIKGSGALHLGSAAGYSAVVLDSSGNLGLGVTPSAWISAYKGFDIGTTTSLYGRTDSTMEFALALNGYRASSGSWLYRNNGAAARYNQNSGRTGGM